MRCVAPRVAAGLSCVVPLSQGARQGFALTLTGVMTSVGDMSVSEALNALHTHSEQLAGSSKARQLPGAERTPPASDTLLRRDLRPGASSSATCSATLLWRAWSSCGPSSLASLHRRQPWGDWCKRSCRCLRRKVWLLWRRWTSCAHVRPDVWPPFQATCVSLLLSSRSTCSKANLHPPWRQCCRQRRRWWTC